jgi:hypothetical protein
VNRKLVPSLRMWSTCRVCRLQLAREAPDPQEPRPEVQEASTQGENRARDLLEFLEQAAKLRGEHPSWAAVKI